MFKYLIILLCLVGCGGSDVDQLFTENPISFQEMCPENTFTEFQKLCPPNTSFVTHLYLGEYFKLSNDSALKSFGTKCGYYNISVGDYIEDLNGIYTNNAFNNGKHFKEVLCCENPCNLNPETNSCQ